MLTPPTPKTLTALGAVLLAVVIACLADLGRKPAAAQAPREKDHPWANLTYQESTECSQCHTVPTKPRQEKGSLDFVLLTEYAIWRTHDKHAQAYAVLEGKRGQKMGELLEVNVTQPEAGCLNCHAMSNLKKAGGKGVALEDGVSCGGCHGPSEKWWAPHIEPEWRRKTPQAKYELGMRDLRDPKVRAELCASCHIGNAAEGKVVTHAMFAAGHPPLPPIDIATFSDNMPRHWRNAREVPAFRDPKKAKQYGIRLKDYHAENLGFQLTEFALVGNVVAVRAAMDLARDRSGVDGRVPLWGWPELLKKGADDTFDKPPDEATRGRLGERWPELAMAHSDCYGCHHDLRNPGFRQQRGFGYQLPGLPLIGVSPGRPVVRSWPLGGLKAGVDFAGKPARADELQELLKGLAQATNARPFGDPPGLAKAAGGLADWCKTVGDDLAENRLYEEKSALRLLHALCALYALPKEGGSRGGAKPAIPDYETARQVASIILVVHQEWASKGLPEVTNSAKIRGELDGLTKQLALKPYSRRPERIDLLVNVVMEAAGAKGNKEVAKDAAAFAEYLKKGEIGNMKTLEELMSNQFLFRLQVGVGGKAFTKALLRVADELQRLSDQEEAELLERIAEFKPEEFQKRLADLNALLPPAE
jgi:hypothetical protein